MVSPPLGQFCTLNERRLVETKNPQALLGFKTHTWADAADATGTLGGALSIIRRLVVQHLPEVSGQAQNFRCQF